MTARSEALDAAHAFILAGGRGTRFWPLSRHARPKQFLDFTGEGSLLALTVARLTPLIPPERQWIITSVDLVDLARECVPQIPAAQILAEPVGRNTAPAVALAATLLEKDGSEAVPFAVLPSDHLISPGEVFREVLARCLESCVESNALFTFGVSPTRPETGYGYIETAAPVGAGESGRVLAFHEKPDSATAEDYAVSGHHYWNSGMFVWNSTTVLSQLQLHEPEMVAALRELVGVADPGTKRFAEAFEKAYGCCRSVSIDYALLEKSSEVQVVGAPFEWNDVGHWNAMADLWPMDSDSNVARGDLVVVDSRNNIVYGESNLTALVGVDAMIVVQTPEVTLVCRRDRAQDLKILLEQLRENKLDQYK